MVELPERFIICDQPREVSAERRIVWRECRSNEAGKDFLVFLLEIGEARLQAIVKFDRGTAVFGNCEDEVEFLLFASG